MGLQALIRDELSLSSWLIVGGTLQALATTVLPRRFALIPIAFLATWGLTSLALTLIGYKTNSRLDGVRQGRFSALMPSSSTPSPSEKEDSTNDEDTTPGDVTLFILGVTSTHPLGKLAPGMRDIGAHFQGMLNEAAANRTKYGFLGSSPPMLCTDSSSSNALITLTYWRSPQHLREFNSGPTHTAGLRWYAKASKKYPHIGIMHELYSAKAGGWENVQHNFRPMGMSLTKYPIVQEDGQEEIVGAKILTGGPRMANMKARMGVKLRSDDEEL
ncbi:hypothetical protein BCR39DRAFT_540028 [Naematelia encephala]|uniref:Uncharacterized protein n=1 Tax=Naematelia encephala TaxID=71784 RepID=A0A1Y2AWD2_9TREE|nr:hypothetical protein BCR39DRAFT_540028 [Naematelia encephala]